MLRWAGAVLGAFVLLVLLGVIGVWWSLRASLAQLDGQRTLPGLQATVRIERDSLGVPTIYATNRIDAARALGFLHAQERFFQMDLNRRAGAGELSELVGPVTLERDREARVHRPRASAKRAMEQASPSDLARVHAYAEGVNAGLQGLRVRPPEYLMLRAKPAPWQPEDSYMVSYTLFSALHDVAGWNDYHQSVLRAALPPTAKAFFDAPDTSWSAALDGSKPAPPPIPTPQEFCFTNRSPALGAIRVGATEIEDRAGPLLAGEPPHPLPFRRGEGRGEGSVALPGFRVPIRGKTAAVDSDEGFIGSNNWVVDGRHSGTGAAIVANDMHLELMVPNTWYRVRLVYNDPELGPQDVVGVTLPGTPAIIAGSNRHIAWALTASCLDTTDLVTLEADPANPHRYRAPSGWLDFQEVTETIHVHGGKDVAFPVAETVWGPVVTRGQTKYALASTLHEPEAFNLRLMDLERARDAETALSLTSFVGTPVLNFLVGDRAGNIGYSILGRLPKRVGFDGSVPVSWADGSCSWQGWLEPADYPRVVNPTHGILWTANNRTLGNPDYNRMHVCSEDNGARAGQIRDDLLALDKPAEKTLWSIYSDDRALFLERWQKLMLAVLEKGSPGKPGWDEARRLVTSWGGRAAVNSQGYRFVRGFRAFTIDLLFEPLNQRLAKYDKGMRFSNEDAAWVLLSARPAHLLNPACPTYDDLLTKAVERLLADLKGRNIPLSQATWGSRNHLGIRHPLSRAVPQLSKWLGPWLDMPDAQVSGDNHMPKVHGEGFGVSERMIVSPGHEENGIWNMPCGQSGHFLSPFYRSEMEHWLKVEPQPLLPGPKAYELDLRPGGPVSKLLTRAHGLG